MTRSIDRAVNLEDIRLLAKRRLPRIAFDFIDGGVNGEECLDRNRQAFRRHTLVPRYLVNIEQRDQSTELFGRRYASPLGISPAGLAGLMWPDADRLLAEAAAEANIPFMMSAAACISIEEAARIAPSTTWFQVYGTRNPDIVDDQVRRAADCGVQVLVLTVDVPIVPRRERNVRNGFRRPMKFTPARVIEGLAHPAWLMGFLKNGVPPLANWFAYAPPGADKNAVADVFGANTPAPGQEWPALERIRRLWKGHLIVKGILHPSDARRAVEAGADGLMVSNHGGRQLDCAPSPLEMIGTIRAASGEDVTLLMDSGVRRGSDVLIARCLGAQACFFARPTLFGAAAAGKAGIARVIEIVRGEIDLVMGQLGCAEMSAMDSSWLTRTILDEAGETTA